MTDATMREVVQRLRAEHRGALLELVEFGLAIEDILQETKRLAVVSSELQQALKNFSTLDFDEERKRLRALLNDAGRVSTQAVQLVVACSAIRTEVLRWNISPAIPNGSGSNGSSAPAGTL